MMKNNPQKIFGDAVSALNNRNLPKAEEGFRQVIELAPSHVPALNLLTVVLMGLGRFHDAEPFIARAVRLNQSSDVSFYNYGLIAKQLNKSQLAYEQFTKALGLNSNVHETWNNRGAVCNDLKKYEAAISDFDKAIALRPDYAAGHANKGKSLTLLKRYDEAFAAYDRALAIKPDLAEAWLGRGNALYELKRYDESLAAYDQALSAKPDLAEAWRGRGNACYELKHPDEAFAAYDKALAIRPDLAGAWLGRGNILANLKRFDEAFAAYDRALSIDPEFADAWLGRGNIFYELARAEDASAAYDKALAINPDLEGAWVGRGNACTNLRRHDEAFTAYDKAFALRPDLDELEGARLHSKMHLCDWSNFSAEREHLMSSVKSGKVSTTPFAFLGFSISAEDQLQYARRWSARKFPASGSSVWHGERYNHERIRVAYLSSDFRDHPVSYLLAGVFEQHDRKRFETIAVSFGADSPDEMRERLKKSFDQFIDVDDRSDSEVASLLRELEVDVAVDLMGYTGNSRAGIFQHRSSPVQVNYLGYPSTMGVDWMDYLIADPTLVAASHQESYAERIAYLPHCYMPNDDGQRPLSDRVFGREEMGLPQGFVFCCFNNSYKLNPIVFDGWMRILKRVEGSVLWLSEPGAAAVTNLRNEANARGVSPDRLVFAKRLPSMSEHLARYRLADLFLDTRPYNAHATASDALWAGVPVLTQIGDTFAGRVAASLLNAVGLPELVTSSPQSYEDLAIELAMNPDRLAAVKSRLANNRLTAPLFDTKLYTRHLEAAYTAMYERHQAGLPPDHISVPR